MMMTENIKYQGEEKPKSMQAIFETELCIKHANDIGLPLEIIEISKNGWCKECEGLPKWQMRLLGYLTHDSWFREVEDQTNG